MRPWLRDLIGLAGAGLLLVAIGSFSLILAFGVAGVLLLGVALLAEGKKPSGTG